MSLNKIEDQLEVLYSRHLIGEVEIKSKNWKKNIEILRIIPSPEILKQLNITLDYKIAKRIIDHVGIIKRRIFHSLEMIIIIITQQPQKEKKQIDFNELNRIGRSLSIQKEKTGIILKIIHPFDQYTIFIKQIRFLRKQQPSFERESNNSISKLSNRTNEMSTEDLDNFKQQKNMLIKQKKNKEQFLIHLKNIKQKITLPLELKEESMIQFSTIEQMFNSLFSVNKFLLKKTQMLHPILTIDSVNIGEIDLSQDISGSFIVFLNQFLSQLDVMKIKSLSFKAKQSLNQQSLLKEYLFIFAKFLSKCTELCQIQIILDFNNISINQFSSMFRHLVLNSLSQNICQKLQIIDISFSNIGQSNQQLLNELSIATFIQSRVDKIKVLNIRCYSLDTSCKQIKQMQPQQKKIIIPTKYLNFFIQNQKFGIEEFENSKLIRHLKFEMRGLKELRLFMKSKLDFSQILMFNNSKNTIEHVSKSLGEEQKKNQQEGNGILSLDILQIIQEKQIDELWTVLINELFMNCRISIQHVICNIQFDEELQIPLPKVNQFVGLRSNSIGMVKTQQRRPFEQMIINLLQQINYKQLRRVEIKNTIYDITFNQLLLKSICACKLLYLEVSKILLIDLIDSKFMISLTNQTLDFLEIIPQLSYSHIQCTIQTLNEDIFKQIYQIFQKSKPSNIIKTLELSIEKKLELTQLQSLLNLVIKIPQVKILTKQFNVQVTEDKVIFKQPQVDYAILRSFNYLNKKYLHLYIDYQYIDFNDQDSFSNFKFVNIYIDNSKVQQVSRIWPTKLIVNTINVHKLVLFGLQKKSKLSQQLIFNLIKFIQPQKLIDVFLAEKFQGFQFNSKTKIIKIVQQLKQMNNKLKFRKEIILSILNEFLI